MAKVAEWVRHALSHEHGIIITAQQRGNGPIPHASRTHRGAIARSSDRRAQLAEPALTSVDEFDRHRLADQS